MKYIIKLNVDYVKVNTNYSNVSKKTEILQPSDDQPRMNLFNEYKIGLPISTTKPCWWCREQFITAPIGAPLIYVPEPEWHFITEGLFCSFSCCKAWIISQNIFNEKYKSSISLLNLLYYKIYGEIKDIISAPSWKLINKWGGFLTPEEFKLKGDSYTLTKNIKRPIMYAEGQIFKCV